MYLVGVNLMRLGYDLTLEQAQKLIMTPELRQAIQMLQFTSQELSEYLEKQMETNPLLEAANSTNDFESIDEYSKEKEEFDWKDFLGKYDDISYRPQCDKDKEKEEMNYENFIGYSPSLKEHLFFQLTLATSRKRVKKIGEFIIECLDENGYLASSIDLIAEEMKTSTEEIEKVLKLIQTFDPVGVGARDLRECLTIQLKEKKIRNTNVYKVVDEYLEDVAQNRLQKISKELNIDLIEVQSICDLIKTLEPKPGRGFSGENRDIRYITPDISLQCIDGEYVIILNDVTAPRLNINSFYKDLISKSEDPNITGFLTDKLNSAMWVIRSIEQRRMTIYKVVESILKFQENFFKKGEKALRPLTLKEVAEDIGVHESTVSRATNGKYIQTPMGLFELKYFFSSGIATNGGDVSATSIKSIIKDLIEKEDPKKPLSDQQIANELEERDIKISRRTVAKYRDELEIPSSSMRRRY